MDMSLSKLQEIVKGREAWSAIYSPWGCRESDNDLASEQHLLDCGRFSLQHVLVT